MVFRVLKTKENMESGGWKREREKMWIQIDWNKFFRMKFNGTMATESERKKVEERTIQMETEMFGKTERLFVVVFGEKKRLAFLLSQNSTGTISAHTDLFCIGLAFHEIAVGLNPVGEKRAYRHRCSERFHLLTHWEIFRTQIKPSIYIYGSTRFWSEKDEFFSLKVENFDFLQSFNI